MSCYSEISFRTDRFGFWQRGLLSFLLLLGFAFVPVGAVAAGGDRYDPEAVAGCLARARGLIREHASTFDLMAAAIGRPVLRERGCREMRFDRPFAAFEGWWQGRWGDVGVAHLWLTVAPGAQLVLLHNDGVASRGINLLVGPNEICGIVIEPNGVERVHQGRFFKATSKRASYLKWLTPGRNYYEAVSCDEGERRYEIVEEVIGPTGPRLGIIARYAPPQEVSALARTEAVEKSERQQHFETLDRNAISFAETLGLVGARLTQLLSTSEQ